MGDRRNSFPRRSRTQLRGCRRQVGSPPYGSTGRNPGNPRNPTGPARSSKRTSAAGVTAQDDVACVVVIVTIASSEMHSVLGRIRPNVDHQTPTACYGMNDQKFIPLRPQSIQANIMQGSLARRLQTSMWAGRAAVERFASTSASSAIPAGLTASQLKWRKLPYGILLRVIATSGTHVVHPAGSRPVLRTLRTSTGCVPAVLLQLPGY